MSEHQFIAVNPILCHQQPTGQPNVEITPSSGESGAFGLDCEQMCKAEKNANQRDALVHRSTKIIGRDALTFALYLHHDLARRLIRAKHDGQTCHPLSADDRDLGLPMFPKAQCYYRSKTGLGKVDVCHLLVGTFQPRSKIELNGVEMRFEHCKIAAR